MESLRRGASGMDAARGVKGHGWPLYAGPGATMERGKWSAARPGWRGKTFWFLLGRLPKGTRPAGRNQAPKHLANRQELKTLIHRVLTACQAILLFQDGEVTLPNP